MKRMHSDEIRQLGKRYRARLINSLSGFKSVNLVGTVDRQGRPNCAIVSSVIHLGADPALMGFIMRPVSVTRDTYDNIMQTGYYTFNHITEGIFPQAHQTSARYPAGVSEFEAVGLHAEFTSNFPAPFVAESPVKIGLQFREKIDIQLNGTILIIGEIQEIYYPDDCLQQDGYLDIEKAGSITVSGLDAYHSTHKLARLSYAKMDRELIVLDEK
ncbi:MAG: flavin reductase [Saprospiraceae bacterium]|nr:flavin reductase [Lewinella sp.]